MSLLHFGANRSVIYETESFRILYRFSGCKRSPHLPFRNFLSTIYACFSFFCPQRLIQARDRDFSIVSVLFSIMFKVSNPNTKIGRKLVFILELHSTFLSENLKGKNNHLAKLCECWMIIEKALRKWNVIV